MKAQYKISDVSFSKLKLIFSKELLHSCLKRKAPEFISVPEYNYSLKEIKVTCKEARNVTRSFVEAYPEKYIKKALEK